MVGKDSVREPLEGIDSCLHLAFEKGRGGRLLEEVACEGEHLCPSETLQSLSQLGPQCDLVGEVASHRLEVGLRLPDDEVTCVRVELLSRVDVF